MVLPGAMWSKWKKKENYYITEFAHCGHSIGRPPLFLAKKYWRDPYLPVVSVLGWFAPVIYYAVVITIRFKMDGALIFAIVIHIQFIEKNRICSRRCERTITDYGCFL